MKKKKQIKNLSAKVIKVAPHVFKPNLWLAIISALAGIALYLNTVSHNFILDDGAVTASNEYVMQGISGIPKILQTEMWHFQNINLGYYRPLSMVTFAIETQFFGTDPHTYHIGNIFLYGLTGFFLCFLLMTLFKNFHPAFSFIITLLFIAHPIHTEVTANIKSRDEILSFLNLILTYFFLLKAYENKIRSTKHLILSCLFFYLALLSKETAMTGILIAPLILFFSKSSSIRQLLLRTIPFLSILILFLLQKHGVLGTLSTDVPKDIVNYPYAEANAEAPSAFLIFLRCIKLVLLPHPLSYDYSFNQIPAVKFSSVLVWLGILIGISLAWLGFSNMKNKSPFSFGILFFLITLAPALGFVLLRGGILAERFLYAPVLGFCIVLVFLLMKITKINFQIPEFSMRQLKIKPLFFLLFILIFGLYSFKTIDRNSYWKNNITLAGEDVKTSPNSCQVRKHYGNELINLGMEEKDVAKKKEYFDKGTEQLREAIKINPHHGEALFKMGVAYQAVEINYDSAIYYYNRAIQEAPKFEMSYCNLGLVYESIGKQELASYFFNKSIEINSSFSDGIKNHEEHKKKTGLDVHIFPSQLDFEAIEKSSEKKDALFYYKLGTNCASQGDFTGGIKCFEKAIELEPKQEVIYINLSNCYGMLGKYAENISTLNKLLAINPNSTQAYKNLAVTYELMGDKAKAKEYSEKAKNFSGK
ncbi:MAG: tetratricopeptide repeat protein [Bacteroidetes bacterium]|nr:tetratricopeptide repeat protein [Bacteroidota bacterium]